MRLRCRTEALLTEATVFIAVGETRRHALYNLCEGNRRHAPLRHTERQRSIYKILHPVKGFRMTGYCVLNDRQSHTERQRSICNIARCTLHIIIEKILHYVLHIIIEKILHFVQNDNKGCKASLRSRRMTMKCAKRKSCAFGTTLRSRRMINKGATDPTLTRRRVSNAHSGYQLFRKAVGVFCYNFTAQILKNTVEKVLFIIITVI